MHASLIHLRRHCLNFYIAWMKLPPLHYRYLQLTVMENFFHRQVERLQFTTDRMRKREQEKKKIDALKVDQQKVVLH